MPSSEDLKVSTLNGEHPAANATHAAFLPVADAWRLWIDDWLAYQANFGTGPDEKIRSAHLATFYAHQLALTVAKRVLADERPPDLHPERLRVGFVPCDSGDGVPAGARRFHFHAASQTEPADLHDCFVESLKPVIDALSARSALSRGSLWRLASDGIAGAFLDTGEMLGDTQRATQMAMAIVERHASPFRSGMARFESVCGDDAACRTYRIRTGCCLVYKAENGRHCDVCVLLPAPERRRRLLALGAF
jgi:ferric iron reductase protein FhuF